MRIVLDTNVVVSGLLNAFGPSAQIVRLVAAGNLDLCYDARILTEYRCSSQGPRPLPASAGGASRDQSESVAERCIYGAHRQAAYPSVQLGDTDCR